MAFYRPLASCLQPFPLSLFAPYGEWERASCRAAVSGIMEVLALFKVYVCSQAAPFLGKLWEVNEEGSDWYISLTSFISNHSF